MSFPLSSTVVIAPFWDDIILTNTGIAEYGVFTPENGSSIINQIEAFLKISQNIELNLNWVLIAKWVNVCPFANRDCTQVSIQYCSKYV